MPFLQVAGLSKSFGGLKAVNNVTFEVAESEIIGLIGPNGSGKTTTLNLLTGFLKPSAGTVTFKGENITGRPRSQMCPKGIARTFQIVKPFLGLTALENVMIGKLYGRESAKSLKAAAEESREALARVGMADKARVLAKDLTLMQRKRLELARALAAKPQLLLLDELMAGLNPKEADDTCALIKQIRDSKITILMVEHIVKAICSLSDRVVVLNMGEKIAEGPPDEITRNPQVIDVYLGRAHA
ncbi:MAG: ABC transporter ATP-binding protein [Anaerolineales bacterium]|nr:ABC transporter ATP-binding protein [Anaerolineales bacterium]